MIKSIREIKKDSKKQVNNHFGDAFIIVFVPFFIMSAITIVLGQLTLYLPSKIELYFDLAIQIILGVLATYMSFKLLIKHIRGENDLSFNNFFKFEKGLFDFVLLRILVSLVIVIAYLPLIPLMSEMMHRISVMVDPTAIERYLSQSDILLRIAKTLKISSLVIVGFWLLTVRLQMIPYIIVDKNKNIIEAAKVSWKITKGSYFKILLFPFTYILWLLLLITFIGLFYVIPLVFVGYGYLYLNLVEEYDFNKEYQ